MSDCKDGRDHAALKRDPIAWLRLAYVGRQHFPADDVGPAETLELRNCSCTSTLCLLLKSEPTTRQALIALALGLDDVDLQVMVIELRESIAARTAEVLAELGAGDESHIARAA